MAIMKMVAVEGGKPSVEDVEVVQFVVEQCIKQYMSKKEAINVLTSWGNIQPVFTETVWEKLEESNKEFFRAYYVKLLVKDQIKKFNSLLEEQAELMHRSEMTSIKTGLVSDGSNIFPTQQFSAPSPSQGNLPVIAGEPDQLNGHNSCGPSSQPFFQGNLDQSFHSIERGFNPDQKPNIGWGQTFNDQMLGSHFNFCSPTNSAKSHPMMSNAFTLPPTSVASDAHLLNNLPLNSGACLLQQYPSTVSRQVTVDFNNCYDLLPENSNMPPFPATDTNFLDPYAADGMSDPAPQIMREPFWC